MVSFRFAYAGAFHCATATGADVVGWLREDDRVALEVSTDDPPDRGVRGNGVAKMSPDEDRALLRTLTERYLGGTDDEPGDRSLAGGREEVHLTVRPERLYSWDLAGRMPGRDADAAGRADVEG